METLSHEELETKLWKSLGVKADEVSHMFWELFDRVELIRLAHFAIKEANKGDTCSTAVKREDGDEL